MGAGVRLFDNVDRNKVTLKIDETIHSPAVTHLRDDVSK
jgi:hypothetical protein